MSTEDSELEYSLKYKDTSKNARNTFITYVWAINEVDKDGKVINEEQIPWEHSIDFEVTHITYRFSDKEYLSAELKQVDYWARAPLSKRVTSLSY